MAHTNTFGVTWPLVFRPLFVVIYEAFLSLVHRFQVAYSRSYSSVVIRSSSKQAYCCLSWIISLLYTKLASIYTFLVYLCNCCSMKTHNSCHLGDKLFTATLQQIQYFYIYVTCVIWPTSFLWVKEEDRIRSTGSNFLRFQLDWS